MLDCRLIMLHIFKTRIGLVILWAFLNPAICLAQTSKPCNPPSQLSFRAVTYDHEYVTVNQYRGSYDAVSQRLAFYEETKSVLPGQHYYHFIFIYGEGVAYEINLSTKKCVKVPSGKFQGWGIPINATFENDVIIGGPSDGIEVMQWSNRMPRKRASWFGDYTRKDCYPVNTYVYDTYNIRRSTTYNVYDIVQGINNPDDFIPPSQCSSSSLQTSPNMRLYRLHSLFPPTK